MIQAEKLAAIRGERVLFKAVNIAAEQGDVIVLRGRNGSGKTTLLRQLAGLSTPQAGRVERREPHHWIGHASGLKRRATPRLHLQHWARVWGGPGDVMPILDKFRLSRPADIPSALLSAGQRRRAALSRLFLTDRKLWLLDEPFTALDAEGKALFSQLMLEHIEKGGAVIAAVHGDFPLPVHKEVQL